MMKRTLALLLAVACAVLMVMPNTVSVSAEDYPNTHVNTGNQRHDIVQVALTQVGYQEGSNNYTKYGVFHNNANAQWCGYFVSWCARQAGIPTSILPRAGLANPSAWGLSTFTSSQRIPQPGDLFFKNLSSNTHMGIVYYVDGNTVYTIEGNTSTTTYEGQWVMIRSHTLSQHRYASPNYTGSSSTPSHTHSYSDHFEDAHPHKTYKQCDTCGYTSYDGGQKVLDNCTQCIQANCSHSYGAWEFSGDSQHKRTCSNCGKTESGDHSWQDSKVLKEANCKESGSKVQKCSTCNAERTRTIDKSSDHTYSAWEYVNDEIHKRACTFCGYAETKEHDLGEEAVWSTDETQHWHACSVCEAQVTKSEHKFGEDCVSPCEVCQYVRPDGHTYSETYSADAEGHWFDCEKCGQKGTSQEHVYSAECDEDCDLCGFTRPVVHTFGTSSKVVAPSVNSAAGATATQEECQDIMASDASGHWYECQVCGKREGVAAHTPGPEATEESAQNCTVCGYELAAKLEHVHKYAPFQTNTMSHWGKCACGQELQPESHVWDINTGACATCGTKSIVQTNTNTNWDFVWFVACGAGLVLVVALISILSAGRRKRKQMEADPYWA